MTFGEKLTIARKEKSFARGTCTKTLCYKTGYFALGKQFDTTFVGNVVGYLSRTWKNA